MRIFIWIIFLFAAAIGIALAARYNVGNVVLFYPPYRIDLSLNFFLLLLALLFTLLYVALQTLGATRRIPQRVGHYRRQKRERASNAVLHEAVRHLFEGRFSEAEQAAAKAAAFPANAGLAALIAARAAHGLQEPAKRDEWLKRLQENQALDTARLVTQAEVFLDAHQPEAALKAVTQLQDSGARHAQVQRLALQANQQAGNWQEVLQLARTLGKHKALSPTASQRLRERAYVDLLAAQQDAASLRQLWDSVPAADRVRPDVALQAANSFTCQALPAEAVTIVENALAHEWDARLLRPYRASAAEEASASLRQQMERCERWQKDHPDDAELSLTLGVLCQKQKLWGKAQRQLERVLSLTQHTVVPDALLREAHLHLAQLCDSLGEKEQADNHYRNAARIS